MEFKLFGIIWDFRPVLCVVWMFAGLLIIGSSFWLKSMGYWSALYFIAAIVYMATSKSILEKLSIK